MKRYNQQGPPDFALNQFAGKRGRRMQCKWQGFDIPV
jgi:hypothetical protein